MKKFNLINSDSEKARFNELISIQKDSAAREFFKVYEDDDFLVFYRVSKGVTKDTENQTELPKKSLQWIVTSITDGFWRKPSDGGLPKNQHSVTGVFDGEEIIISRTMNAAYDEPGFKIVNKSRSSYILKTMNQSMQITDAMFEKELCPLFKRFAS